MSDTDSAVLPHPLPNHLVGNGLGQMKLEQIIELGIFIRKKLYYIKNTNNQESIKSSGIDSSHLNYELFLKLLKGETITIERTTFNVDWTELNIKIKNFNINIQGLVGKVKTIYNTPDVNFKFISIYNPKNFNIIIHPLWVNHSIIDKIEIKVDKIKINTGILDEFSYLEIFIYFIFILPYLAIITFFLNKLY